MLISYPPVTITSIQVIRIITTNLLEVSANLITNQTQQQHHEASSHPIGHQGEFWRQLIPQVSGNWLYCLGCSKFPTPA